MSQALSIRTEVAPRIRRAMRGGRLLGAIWSELYRLDRDAVIERPAAAVDEFRRPSDATVDRQALPRRIGASAGTWFDSAVGLAVRVRECIATWAKRRRARLELLDYLAQDHRAAADMGTTRADAVDWAQQPFWRP